MYKKESNLKPILITSGVFIIIIGIMLYFYIKDPSRNYLYIDTSEKIDIILARRDIGIGETLTNEDVYILTVDKENILNFDAVHFDMEDIVDKKVLYPINQNQFIYKNYLLSKENWYEDKVRYALPITIPGTVANSVRAGDYVDVLVAYSEEDINEEFPKNYDIVISKALIEELKDSNGLRVQEDSLIPSFALISFSYNELDNYLDAQNKGNIFLTIYDDPSIEASIPTYEIDYLELMEGENTDDGD